MKKTALFPAAAGLILAASTMAFADDKEDIQARFSQHDSNGDGIISYAEMTTKVQEKFSEFDKNQDGFIALDELPRTIPLPMDRVERRGKRLSRMKEKMAEHGREMPEEFLSHMEERGKPTRIKFMAKLDKDGDELVSLEEFSRPAIRHFKGRDVNGDGNVTLEEIKDFRKHRMAKFLKKRRHMKN